MSAQPRTGIKVKERPSSAIFIGGGAGSPAAQSFSTPPHLPDLPEPPSPISSISSRDSGLPSPPATNSTGSGSTGDSASIAIRGRRADSVTGSGGGGESSESDGGDRRMLSGSNMRAFHAAFSKTSSRATSHEPDDYDNNHDYDRNGNFNFDDEEDNTARLDRRTSNRKSSENVSMLLRMKSLNERNQRALEKLTSISRISSPAPSRTSMALTSVLDDREPDGDITQAALAAVASSRRSPTLGRKRQPLPREFRDSPSSAADSSSSGGTASRRGSIAEPDLSRSSRSATVRDSARRHQSRGWYSEDMSVTSPPEEPGSGRRQAHRGGSAESPLVTGRLVGEGLRAAGLSNTGAGTVRRVMSLHSRPDDIFDSPIDRDAGRQRERRSDWTTPDQRVRSRSRTEERRERYPTESSSRAATSLADYAHMRHGDEYDDEEPRTAPPLRNHRSAYPLQPREPSRTRAGEVFLSREHDRERERPATSLNRYREPESDRTYSPLGPRRTNPPVTPRSTQKERDEPDHARLMWDSVATFESLISRLPAGLGVGGTQSDLAANVASLATLSDRLNASLKAGASRAVERQIHADLHEGDPSGELAELNRAVGTEFREAARMSDDQIRAVTGLLLGMGRVIRELGIDGGMHARSVSLGDETLARRLGRSSVSPDLNGRLSSASRRSWEAARDRDRDRERDRDRDEALSQLQGRESAQLTRRHEIPHHRTGSGPRSSGSGGSDVVPPSSSMRRVYSPKYRETLGLASFDSQETIMAGYEPSPTPASRTHKSGSSGGDLTRSRTLPPINITEPSHPVSAERTPIGGNAGSIRRRSTTITSTGTESSGQQSVERERIRPSRGEPRKASVTSISTVRAPTKPFPALSTPSATTALTTHTVTNSPVDRLAFPRSSSGRANGEEREGHASAVFSRPSTVSVSALSGLQQHLDPGRRRTLSTSSDNADAGPPETPARKGAVTDTERETRRRTLTSRTNRNSPGVNVHPADRAASFVPSTTRTRRKTVTEITWAPP
ncbi:hypothetical protein EV121DRAFT_269992 [Schizophyllum commune]